MMPKRRGDLPGHSAGIALVAVLWSVVLLTLIATMAVTLQRTQSHVARRFVDMALAEIQADSALNVTLLKLSVQQKSAMGSIMTDIPLPSFAREVSVSVGRERERVDLNAAGPNTLTACFMSAGFPADTARSMAAKAIDWRDTDDIPEPGGAEAADYHAAGLHYGPRNGPFQSVEELRQVMGMDTLHNSTLSRFTVYTHRGDDDASSLIGAEGTPLTPHCGGSLDSAGGPSAAVAGQSTLIGEVVRIHACVSAQVRLCRLVVARLTGNVHNPWQIFIWKTEVTTE